MQKASFSITNYQFPKVIIDLEKHLNSDLNVNFETNGVYDSANSSFDLFFTVKVSNNEQSAAFVEVSCKGVFKFEEVNNFNEIPDFFYRNSIAILFPYLRAFVSMVTTQANVPGIILPTLNLSHLEHDLKNNTLQK
jgi:preprotein translocase subunit SecB